MKKHWAEAVLALWGIAAIAVLIYTLAHPRYVGGALARQTRLEEEPSYDAYRERIQTTIRKLGPKAVPQVLEEVRWGGAKVATISALTRLGPAVVPDMVGALDDPSPNVRLVAVRTLTCMVPKLHAQLGQLVPKFIKLLDDPSPEIRLAAVLVISRIGTDRAQAVPALIAVLERATQEADDDTHLMQEYAIYVLGKIGPCAQMALPALQRLLAEGDCGAQQRAAVAVWQVSHNPDLVVPHLTQMLHDPDRTRRHFGVMMLRRISEETECQNTPGEVLPEKLTQRIEKPGVSQVSSY
jgi:hypothetical protein